MIVQDKIDLGNGQLIAIGDLGAIVDTVASRDLLDVPTVARLIEALAASLRRRAAPPAPLSLQSLLDRVTDENRHAEVQTGPAVGKEVW